LIEVEACGNVLVNTAFLYGLACRELSRPEFDADDPYFPLLVTVRARKETAPANPPRRGRSTSTSGEDADIAGAGAAVLLYHRVASRGGAGTGLSIRPQGFRRQMRYGRDGGHRCRSKISSGPLETGGRRRARWPSRSTMAMSTTSRWPRRYSSNLSSRQRSL